MRRLLRVHGCEESLWKVMGAVQEVRAARVEIDGEVFLARADLPSLLQKAFPIVGLHPPSKVQPLLS